MATRGNQPVARMTSQPTLPANMGSMLGVEAMRAIQEVQAQLVIAKQFPRDESMAMAKIEDACTDPILADEGLYSYPRGQEVVAGLSIRAAEEALKMWGNCQAGVRELSTDGESTDMLAYAVDLESNTRFERVFTVKHQRDTKNRSYKLTDQRDIYENNANLGARRMRACILEILPTKVKRLMEERLHKTLEDNNQPDEKKLKAMFASFEKRKVTEAMILELLGKESVDQIVAKDMVRMKTIFQSVRAGESKLESWFPSLAPKGEGETEGSSLNAQLRESTSQPAAATEQAAPKSEESSSVEDGGDSE